MKLNYFNIHKNKKPKKAKYSNPYTKLQRENIEKCIEDIIKRIDLIKGTARVSVDCSEKNNRLIKLYI